MYVLPCAILCKVDHMPFKVHANTSVGTSQYVKTLHLSEPSRSSSFRCRTKNSRWSLNATRKAPWMFTFTISSTIPPLLLNSCAVRHFILHSNVRQNEQCQLKKRGRLSTFPIRIFVMFSTLAPLVKITHGDCLGTSQTHINFNINLVCTSAASPAS